MEIPRIPRELCLLSQPLPSMGRGQRRHSSGCFLMGLRSPAGKRRARALDSGEMRSKTPRTFSYGAKAILKALSKAE